MRSALKDTRELAQKLSALEQELKGGSISTKPPIVDILQRITRILDPAPERKARATTKKFVSTIMNY